MGEGRDGGIRDRGIEEARERGEWWRGGRKEERKGCVRATGITENTDP